MATEIEHTKRNTECLLDIATDVIQMLTRATETIGVAESLTGGGLMAALTSVPGASAVFRGGVVSYATPLKQLLLNVDADLIAREGVIHGDVAAQMAEAPAGCRLLMIASPRGVSGQQASLAQHLRMENPSEWFSLASPLPTGIAVWALFTSLGRESGFARQPSLRPCGSCAKR
ncbi:hypothetical protein G7Y89_g7302 [Cudoniella acicularis]|uniref:CinA C-terminal domain-containing protein n=1 Tax=Cudoniella acicularis TaxID=354080 RepID=A0A8H4RKQ5_9HELO|nr:hypothetical protein G7Y89_g7302 [Cudoniella acicularis]